MVGSLLSPGQHSVTARTQELRGEVTALARGARCGGAGGGGRGTGGAGEDARDAEVRK